MRFSPKGRTGCTRKYDVIFRLVFLRSRIGRWLLLLFGLLLLGWVLVVAVAVHEFGRRDWLRYGPPDKPKTVEAIIVLGAGVDGDRPSPVYESRLRHAVELHREGVAPILIFTGGKGNGDLLSEGEVGRNYALAKGVPTSTILIETTSRTTLGNLKEARALIEAAAISEDIAIVSDPHHLLRAGWMAHGTGMRVWPSPTPYSRYRSASTRIPAILREVYFLHHYALFGQ